MSYSLDTREGNFESKHKSLRISDSNLSQTVNASTFNFVSGSEIAYLPVEGSDYVVYETSFYMAALSYECFVHVKLTESSDGGQNFSDVANSDASWGSRDTSMIPEQLCSYKILLDSWANTEKIFRLEAQGVGSLSCYLHRVVNGSLHYNPVTTCYSITEV